MASPSPAQPDTPSAPPCGASTETTMSNTPSTSKFNERPAKIHLDGWAGRSTQAVIVVGETPKRYRVRPAGDSPMQVAGRRWVHRDQTALVPKHVVMFDDGREPLLATLAKRWAAFHPSNEWTRRDEYGELHDPSVWTSEGWESVKQLDGGEREVMLNLVRQLMEQHVIGVSFHHGLSECGGSVDAQTEPRKTCNHEAIAEALGLPAYLAEQLCEEASAHRPAGPR